MIDWAAVLLTGIVNLIVGFISFVLGMWYFNKFVLPKILASQGIEFIKNLQKDPQIKGIITKFKKIADQLEPVVEKMKNFDLDKLQEDLKPFLESIKKIDPKTVEDALRSIKQLTNSVTKTPEIPEPD